MKENKDKKLSKKDLAEKQHRKWVLIVTISTFFSTMLITYISDALLANTPLLLSFLLLIFIITFGVISDIVGVAVTAVSPKPFNAMASRKVYGAKTAVNLIRNAAKFSNICNDVVGDICGVVSGAIGVSITAQFLNYYPLVNAVIVSLVMSGLIAAFTVGGKAIGKDFAIKNSVKIITIVSKILTRLNITFDKKKK